MPTKLSTQIKTIDNFLEKCKLLKLAQKVIKTRIHNTEMVVKDLLTKRHLAEIILQRNSAKH